MSSRATPLMLERLIVPLRELRDEALAFEASYAQEIAHVEPEYRASAKNLLHYLSVRQRDIRPLQRDLTVLGLSSLGRMESHVLATLNAVIDTLEKMSGVSKSPKQNYSGPVNMRTGSLLLKDHTLTLFGQRPANRGVHIMVTMPTEAAYDPLLIQKLLESGMDIMRINCAHDDSSTWRAMIENLRKAERLIGRKCKIQIDLGGPKLRTGGIEPIGKVVKFRPTRDPLGHVVVPAQVWFTPKNEEQFSPPGTTATIPVEWKADVTTEPGDIVTFKDIRNRRRRLLVSYLSGKSFLATCDRTGYVKTGTPISLYRKDAVIAEGVATDLPDLIVPIEVREGDSLLVIRGDHQGCGEKRGKDGHVVKPAMVACSLDEVFEQAKTGEQMWFDDGKIGGRIKRIDKDGIMLEIIHAGPSGTRLRPEKGINLPDTNLVLPSLTSKDIGDLELMARHVDLVALSFVQEPEDIRQLEYHLHRLGAGHAGIVLKIENRLAFENLPKLLLQSLHSPPVGVMVARGDLAVELGFERLAEVQEEILWLCEAAHVPVIWATQVLEGLAKRGAPSRAEVTDAAASARAECVMLNKGPNILKALHFLDDVLQRMADHASKRSARLRRLSVSNLNGEI